MGLNEVSQFTLRAVCVPKALTWHSLSISVFSSETSPFHTAQLFISQMRQIDSTVFFPIQK